jgi:hypothetical protein
MSPAEETARMQERLARTLAAGAFEEAGRLLRPFFARAEQAIMELPPADRGELASHVLEFYHWAIVLVRAGRAQACEQLRDLLPPSPYRSTPARSRQHWRYDA